MGSLIYDGTAIQFDDRLLTHLQIIVVQKLRRDEAFLMSWRDAEQIGNGRSSIWIHPAIPLYFKFSGSRIPTINRAWLSQMTTSANSSQGLVISPEITDPDGE
jgi:hypothetical protein